MWRVPYVRYEPAAPGRARPPHRRRAPGSRAASTTAAPPPAIAKRHPGKARPLNVSPWTTAAWARRRRAATRRPRWRSPRPRPRCSPASSDDVPTRPHRDRARRPRHAALRPRRRRRADPRRGGRSPPRPRSPSRARGSPLAAALVDHDARSSSPTISRTVSASGSGCLRAAHARPAAARAAVASRTRRRLRRYSRAVAGAAQMGRDRGLAAGRAGRVPVPVQAAGARLRRERRVPGPRGGVDAGRRRSSTAASRAASETTAVIALHARRPAQRGRRAARSPPTRWRCASARRSRTSSASSPRSSSRAATCRRSPAAVEPDQGDLRGPDDPARRRSGRSDDATETVVARRRGDPRDRPDPDAKGLRAYVTGEAGFAADQSAALEGIDETLLAGHARARPRPAAADLPLAGRRARARVRRRHRVHRRRGARLRGRQGRALPGHRPGDGDPDRADVRRGHRLLPAAARALPRGARPTTRPR